MPGAIYSILGIGDTAGNKTADPVVGKDIIKKLIEDVI